MKNLKEVHRSIVIFQKNDKGELYPVQLTKEKAWYIGKSHNDFSHLSAEYIKSAAALIQLNKDIGESFGAVPIYLAIHGLELKLKGALHSFNPDNYSIERLKNIRHDILKLLRHYHASFPSLLVQFKSSEKKEIESVFKNYKSKNYEYLDKNLGTQGKILNVDFQLMENVVFKICDTINNHLDHYFSQ